MEALDPKMVEGLSTMQRPIPGQSMTNDPANPAPFEKAPKNTNLKQTQELIFSKLIDESVYVPIMSMLASGEANVMEVTQNLLYAGFREGQWNPDMMMLVAEPTAYMIMALAERAGIDYQVDEEPNELPDEDEQGDERMAKFKDSMPVPEKGSIPAGIIPKEITAKLDQAPVESLMAAKKTQGEQSSLLEA